MPISPQDPLKKLGTARGAGPWVLPPVHRDSPVWEGSKWSVNFQIYLLLFRQIDPFREVQENWGPARGAGPLVLPLCPPQ